MNKTVLILIALLSVSLVSGCSSKKPRPTPTSSNAAVPTDESQTSGADASKAFGAAGDAPGAGVAGPTGAQLQNRTIYFDFDSSEVKSDYNSLITAHARYLAANPSTRVRLEGNTDERGSREYNIGLGERRGAAGRRGRAPAGVGGGESETVCSVA